MNNRIVSNLNSDNLAEIIMEEIMQLDENEIGKYAEEVVAELFHSFDNNCGKTCGKRNTKLNIG